MTDYTARYLFLTQHLDLPGATGVPDARWEFFQLRHLLDESAFRIETKSRQIAWSFLSAAEAVADAVQDGRDSIFVSINQEEAAEKIRYARAVYEHIDGYQLPRIARDNQMGLEFANGARLTSLPARPPRGRARANVYLDEFAHVRLDAAIYTAALPVTSKGGRIRIGSSPMGASGRFWEIAQQKIRPYPGYTRTSTPWWHAYSFCADPRTARQAAPKMITAERVARFGNVRIQTIYANMPEEDFRQEYEAVFVDESTAWITWEEIRRNQDAGLLCHLATARPGNLQEAQTAIRALAADVRAGNVEQVFAGGMDIGRTRNASEIYLVGWSTTDSHPLRLAITLEGMEFDDQLAIVADVLRELPLTGLLIDETGIGRNLADNAARLYPGKAQGVTFTAPLKIQWATDAKMLIQQNKTPLPVDRDIAYQIHSIKRLLSGNLLRFDTDANEKHHADKFWAWALALAGTQGDKLGPVSDALAEAFGWMQQ